MTQLHLGASRAGSVGQSCPPSPGLPAWDPRGAEDSRSVFFLPIYQSDKSLVSLGKRGQGWVVKVAASGRKHPGKEELWSQL